MPKRTMFEVDRWEMEVSAGFQDLTVHVFDELDNEIVLCIHGDLSRPDEAGNYGEHIRPLALELTEDMAAHLGYVLVHSV